MNNLENNVSNKLLEIAKLLIVHYFENEHSAYPNIDKELQRIVNISNNINFKFVPKEDNQTTNATHSKKENLISYYIDDEMDLLNFPSLYPAVPTLVHELLHAISSEDYTNGATFIEEGMVSYLTANIIRYAISNPIEIKDIDNKQFQDILKKQDLTNAYVYPCEFISNLNLIMSSHNIDAQCEYVFNRNGLQRLINKAKTFSNEFGEILANQENKDPVFSRNTTQEYDYFFKTYNNTDFDYNLDLLPDTDIQMNRILMNVLISGGQIKKYPILSKRCLNLVSPIAKRKLLEMESKSFTSSEENLKEAQTALASIKYDYKVHDSVHQTNKQFDNILSIYKNVVNTYSSFTPSDILSILIAYDMIQKSQKIDEIQDICDNYQLLISPSYSDYLVLINKVYKYYDYIQECCNNGQNINDILYNKIYQSCMFETELPEAKSISLENYWDKLDIIGKNTKKYFWKKDIILYDTLYSLSTFLSERYFAPKRVYTQKDYEIFSEKLNGILQNSDYPNYMVDAGKSTDFIFIKNLVRTLNPNSEYFCDQVICLLNILKNNELDLGENVDMKPKGNELNSLGEKINSAYKKLKEQNLQEKLSEFSSLLNDLCIKDDKLFVLTVFADCDLGKIKFKYDDYMIETLKDLFGKDSLKRYNIRFDDEPKLDTEDCR